MPTPDEWAGRGPYGKMLGDLRTRLSEDLKIALSHDMQQVVEELRSQVQEQVSHLSTVSKAQLNEQSLMIERQRNVSETVLALVRQQHPGMDTKTLLQQQAVLTQVPPEMNQAMLSQEKKIVKSLQMEKSEPISDDMADEDANLASYLAKSDLEEQANGHHTSEANGHREQEPEKLGEDFLECRRAGKYINGIYKTSGLPAKLATSPFMDKLTIAVVFVNAVNIGFDAQYNESKTLLQADLSWVIIENFFCIYFCSEWVIRFIALRAKSSCYKERLFAFDTFLVAMIVLETWLVPCVMFVNVGPDGMSGQVGDAVTGFGAPLQMLKLTRLLRLARMGRLLNSFPEVVGMIRGVFVASRSVGSVVVLLLGLLYIHAVMVFIFCKDGNDRDIVLVNRYGTLHATMWTLLIEGAFLGDIYNATKPLLDNKLYGSFFGFCLFVILSAFTVMNLLIGVLCDVVNKVSAEEKEVAATRVLKRTIVAMLQEMDSDNSGLISREELQAVFSHAECLKVLNELQVDVHQLFDSLEMHFGLDDDGNISMTKIVELILMMRGDRHPTIKDMIHGQTFTRWKVVSALKKQEERMMKRLKLGDVA